MTDTKQKLELRLCGPRGFCAGVDRAIQMVVLALKKYGAPVYVRHEIVHNRYVVEGLEQQGAIFVKELDEIPETKQPVIFSAHGVPRSVPENAESLNLLYLDATCPLVSKVHKQAIRHIRQGRHVLLIGHAGHPEVIGTMGQVEPHEMTLIEDVEQAQNYEPKDADALGFVTQTTLSVDDTLIVGAPNSSNSKRLVEVATRAGAKNSILVQKAAEIPWDQIKGAKAVGLSAGASAPEILVNEIIEAFRERFDMTLNLVETVKEDEEFLVARDLRDTELTPQDMAFVNGAV